MVPLARAFSVLLGLPQVKISDFGLAIRVRIEGEHTPAKGKKGTAGYWSPQQVKGEGYLCELPKNFEPLGDGIRSL